MIDGMTAHSVAFSDATSPTSATSARSAAAPSVAIIHDLRRLNSVKDAVDPIENGRGGASEAWRVVVRSASSRSVT
jgi:hypothetical protein